MGARRRAREHALKVLYQLDVTDSPADEAMESHWLLEPETDPSVRAFAQRLVRDVIAARTDIDGLISAASTNWRIERIGTVDRNILRLALGELRSAPDTPDAVVIDEAVELAKEYGDSESAAFVNGILEGARRRLRAETPPR